MAKYIHSNIICSFEEPIIKSSDCYKNWHTLYLAYPEIRLILVLSINMYSKISMSLHAYVSVCVCV
jgi:hypothetical protein